jgi:tripartite-type tricarboxylate transporter receptor subunit TctC
MIGRTVVAALALAGLSFAALPAQAADYPSRTITMIVPYPAGGPTDQTARQIAQSMSQTLKQTVIVENVSGGGTIIATNKVAKAAPDGYTLLLHNLQISANVTLYKNLPFNTEKDLTPIIFVNSNPLVLVGRKSLQANDLKQLLADMKKTRMKAAIPGYGATGHLATALLAQLDGAKVDMIPYRGAAPALTDILGGHVDLFFATPQSVVQQVAVGQMKAFGITSNDKVPELPNVKSFVDVFGPKLKIQFWQALFAPSGTPQAVIDKLNHAVQVAVSDPKLLAIWKKEGVSAYPKDEQTTAAARKMMASEVARWGKVIKDNNIHLDQ